LNNTLIILAGGKSSRMKKSASSENLSAEDIKQANEQTKGLIGVGEKGRPLLDYLLNNAYNAGYKNIYFLTGEDASGLKAIYGNKQKDNPFHKLTISYATQFIPRGREKPLGTADALFQTLQQYPELQKTEFTMCNCDNLYSVKAFKYLSETDSPNAWINYDRDGLEYTPEKIAGFAITAIDENNKLIKIVEKPTVQDINKYSDRDGIVRVSMNIFKFTGIMILPFLRDCPLSVDRNEKEIQIAISNMIAEFPGSMLGIPLKEHVPDLTSKDDIARMREYLSTHYVDPEWE